jgi:predicted nucleic acid-binding Zn ribbon protein
VYLLLIILISFMIIRYQQTNESKRILFTSYVDFERSENKNSIEVEEEERVLKLNLEKEEEIDLEFKDRNYTLKFDNFQNEIETKIEIDGQEIVLEEDTPKIVSIESEELYDLVLIAKQENESLDIYLQRQEKEKSSSEEILIILEQLELASQRQRNTMIIFIIIIFIAIFTYVFALNFLPAYLKKLKLKKENPLEFTKKLISEFHDYRGKKKKEKRIYARIENLYGYLNKAEKKEIKEEVKEIRKYINEKGDKE